MHTIELSDSAVEMLASALVGKVFEFAKHAEKYPSPSTLRHLEDLERLRDRFCDMANPPEYTGSGRGDREDFHSDG